MKGLNTFLIFLQRNKLFAFVNLFGLITAFVFILLIGNMVVRQLSIDKNLKDVERTYVLCNEHFAMQHYLVGERLASRYPEIEDWCAVNTESFDSPIYTTYQDKKTSIRLFTARENFFQFFSFPLLAGDPKQILADRYSIVLTESAAYKIFGKEPALGKTLRLSEDQKSVYTVTGIMKNIDNSLFNSQLEAIVPFDFVDFTNYGSSRNNTQMNNAGGTFIFARFSKGIDPNLKKQDMLEFLKTFFWIYQTDNLKQVFWTPMRELYFSGLLARNMEQYNPTKVIIFLASGILILLMAVFNYLSMNVAQISYRAKEMATRRLLGSSQRSIFWRMIAESFSLIVIALVTAFGIAVALEPTVNGIMQTRTDLYGDLDFFTLSGYIAGAVLIAVLTGCIPASLLSRYNPMDIVKGNFRRKTKSAYLRVLYILQTGLTLAMLTCSIYLGLKVYRILHEPRGYSYGHILDYQHITTRSQMQLFRNEALKKPYVKEVCLTQGTPNNRGNNNTMKGYHTQSNEPVNISFQVFRADTSFTRIFHIPVQRNTAIPMNSKRYLFSESTFQVLGLDKEGNGNEIRTEYQAFPIGGHFADLKLGSILSPQSPHMIIEEPADSIYPWNVLVEVQEGNTQTYKKELDELYTQITDGVPFSSVWYADEVKQTYQDLICMQQLLFGFTGAAFIISLLGLTAMSLYFISQRKHDIAIRKVFGSNAGQEMSQLMKFAFSSLVIALILALPLVWIGVRLINQTITYEYQFAWWICPMAFFVITGISLLSVWGISRKATHENPVQHLKAE